MEERIYLAFLHALGISHEKLFELFKKHKEFKNTYLDLNSSHLESIGYKKAYITRVLNKRKKQNTDYIEKIFQKRNVNIVLFDDPNFPDQLKQISAVPYLLYVRGNLDNSPKLAVVGTRKISSYGENTIYQLIPDLSKYFHIVSGGALGADTIAHKTTLDSCGKTIAVLGTGIDIDYPVGNRNLYDSISQNGAVISSFPIGEGGSKYSFPIRNEIVAGLSAGTIIIEAQKKSGTLITAQLTLDLGRDLFAVPGSINSVNSYGCNYLIQSGQAKLILESGDILNEFNINASASSTKKKVKFADIIEKNIYENLLREPLNVDQISQSLDMEITTTISKLSMMEIQGFIQKNIAGKYEIL